MNSSPFSTKVVLIAVVVLHLALAQLDCNIRKDSIVKPNTSTQAINMSCSVDISVGSEFLWEWLKLSLDNRIEEQITDRLISAPDISVYSLEVQCDSSGFYQALYRSSADNDTCLSSCYYILEVEEVRLNTLRAAFSAYPIIVNGSVPASPTGGSAINGKAGTVQSVGTCGNRFYLPSKCTVEVEGMWYRNGMEIPEITESEKYSLSNSGELRIQILTNSTIGYYVCVTTINSLGQYQTDGANIILSLPTTDPPPSTSNSPSTTALSPTIRTVDNLFGTLMVWQFGVIIGVVSLVIIVALVSGMVCMGFMTVRRRREMTKKHSKVRYNRASRQQTMIEEIQLMEDIDTHRETVDFDGPVEISFNSILFEELLYKGTFKVVHHGTVNKPIQGKHSIQVAIKRLRNEKSELGYAELMAEAYVLRTFQEKAGSHPNFVSLLGLTTQGRPTREGPTCLLLEFVPYGTLDRFLVSLRAGPMPEWYMKFVRDTLRGAYHKHASGDMMSIVLQVAEGMKYLTDHGFIHRDLSTRNIMMGERLNVKIANPGMHHEGHYYVVTEREHFLQDMAPECLQDKCYSICSDIWSFGILVYRIVTLNSIPFPDVEADELHGRIAGGYRPQLLASFSNELYFLLQRCWQFIPTERPSFSNIFSDLFHMAEKPTCHILLKATEDFTKPGYVSENGQVFLQALPPYALDEDEPPQKKSGRNSGIMRSLISSIDDTIYTRETTETYLLDFTHSENDNYEHLKGDISLLPLKIAEKRVNETDTSSSDVAPTNMDDHDKPVSRNSSKVQSDSTTANGIEVKSTGKGSNSSRKKKRRTLSNSSKEKQVEKTVVTNTGNTKKAFPPLKNSSIDQAGIEDSGGLNSDEAPSVTEGEEKEEITSDLSGSEGDGSQNELVRF